MKFFKVIIISGLFFVLANVSTPQLFAQNVDEIKAKINERNENIKQLESEIQSYQSQLESIGKEANTLKNALAELELSRKKLETTQAIMQAKIDNTNSEIKELSFQIEDKSERIGDSRRVIAQSLSSIAQTDDISLLETLLGSMTLSAVFNGAEQLSVLQSKVGERIHDLQDIRSSLESNKKKTEQKKGELLRLQIELSNQKKILAETLRDKNNLLAATKNTESDYKRILNAKQTQKNAFEKELENLESALKIAIDPSKIPKTGNGVLAWPLAKINVTQYFGNTPFSTANPQIYNGKGHTGVDFAASIGTPVLSAASGVVVGVGNTDLVRGCASFGKWIMVKHANGLSTLYAHLSLQTVAEGDQVGRGQAIGYSGNTGYSTGPHLHFGVYATEGVRISKLTTSTNCRNATIPLADPKAYLNPLSFL